jgi:hypothetical protein
MRRGDPSDKCIRRLFRDIELDSFRRYRRGATLDADQFDHGTAATPGAHDRVHVRKDVNASGTLTVADKGIANANLTRALPAP